MLAGLGWKAVRGLEVTRECDTVRRQGIVAEVAIHPESVVAFQRFLQGTFAMAVGKTGKLPVGTQIVVNDGVASPDFPEISFAGWRGTIVEYHGKKADPRYIVEWDASTLAEMPAEYASRCEDQQLFAGMACLERDQVVAVD